MLMRSLPNLSMVRRLNGANSNTEGWALYCEQLMLDEGYGGGDSKSKLRRKVAQLNGRSCVMFAGSPALNSTRRA